MNRFRETWKAEVSLQDHVGYLFVWALWLPQFTLNQRSARQCRLNLPESDTEAWCFLSCFLFLTSSRQKHTHTHAHTGMLIAWCVEISMLAPQCDLSISELESTCMQPDNTIHLQHWVNILENGIPPLQPQASSLRYSTVQKRTSCGWELTRHTTSSAYNHLSTEKQSIWAQDFCCRLRYLYPFARYKITFHILNV